MGLLWHLYAGKPVGWIFVAGWYKSLRKRLALAALALAILLFPVQALTVRQATDSGLLWAVAAGTGSEFRLSWQHSVSRQTVSEDYAVEAPGRVCLRRMVFDHEGPGLPAGPEDGLSWRFEGNRAIVTGYNLCLAGLDVRVAPFGHRLDAGGWNWDMLPEAGCDKLVRVTAEQVPLVLILYVRAWQWLKSNTLP